MRGKWVDNFDYVGPDRRRVAARRMFKERRKFDEGGEAPSLPAMIRRLRVQLLGLKTAQEKTMMMQLARMAITQAEMQGKNAAADLIKECAKMVMAASAPNPSFIATVDAKLVEALNYAA